MKFRPKDFACWGCGSPDHPIRLCPNKTPEERRHNDSWHIGMSEKIELGIAHSAYSESVSRVERPIGEASKAEPKLCVWFLWGNGNELRGLRAKFWRGPSYHVIM